MLPLQAISMSAGFNVIILSAGTSSRMGFPKAFLPFSNQTTFLDKIVDQMTAWGCKKICVVLNSDLKGQIGIRQFRGLAEEVPTIVWNRFSERGRFYSIYKGVQECGYKTPCFLTNIDTPLFQASTLGQLAAAGVSKGYVSPVFEEKGGHPILLHTDVLKNILLKGTSGLPLSEFLAPFKRTQVRVDDEGILKNINTPEDYQRHFGPLTDQIQQLKFQ